MPHKQSQPQIDPKDLASNLGFATHLLEQQLPKDAPQQEMQPQDQSQQASPVSQEPQRGPQQATGQPQEEHKDPIISRIEELKGEGFSKMKIKQALSKAIDETFNAKES